MGTTCTTKHIGHSGCKPVARFCAVFDCFACLVLIIIGTFEKNIQVCNNEKDMEMRVVKVSNKITY